jgi:Protein of unknown function (DUF2852)
MSPDMGKPFEAGSNGRNGGANHRGCRHGGAWKPVDIIVMVMGFAVYWPLGLAVILWKFWQKKSGYEGDVLAFAREKWESCANWSWASCGASGRGFAARSWNGAGFGSSGNRAFDDWRSAELARLEEERQKLVSAEREFAEFMENLRRARDREEFDRFMNERRNGRGQGGATSV